MLLFKNIFPSFKQQTKGHILKHSRVLMTIDTSGLIEVIVHRGVKQNDTNWNRMV